MASSHGDEGPPASSMAATASMVTTPMASRHEDCERLKDILKEENSTTLAVVEASSKNSKDTEADPMIMNPRLLMAARRGDCKALENVLINHQVRPNDLKTEPSFVIHMPEGGSRTQEIQEGTDQHSQKATAVLLDGVTLDSEGNSALHVVASSGDSGEYCDCATLIYGKRNKLLDAENQSGDTPVHCAARAGNHNMVSHLIALATPPTSTIPTTRNDDGPIQVIELLRKKNKLGETALHEAVRSANTEVIENLMSKDPDLANHRPSDGTSPLYLAISLGHLDIAWDLMQRSSYRLSYSGPDGQNVFHIAVFQDEVSFTTVLSILLKKCKEVKVDIQEGAQKHTVPLLLHLTSQRDKNGSTPLHFAASLETGSSYYSRVSEKFWPKPRPTTLLLEANESMVYQPDNEGSYPIHVAACNRRLKAVKILLRRCPECATLRDKRGRTFLHVAVDKKRYDVVKFAAVRAEFASLLNEQDKQGDTALHLADKVGSLSIFNVLFRNRHVCLDLLNKDGLTPRDISWIMIPAGFYNKKNQRFMIYQSLAQAGSAVGFSRPDHFYDKYTKERDENRDSEFITSVTQVVGISSVLVATVTFAAAFTLPGGYRADDHVNGGTPTLFGSYAFDVFIISNTLAFICSLIASASLLYSGVSTRDISTRRIHYRFSRLLLHTSIGSLVVAFAMGMYVVLAPVALSVARSVLVISFGSLLCGSKNVDVWRYLVQANAFRVRFGIFAARSQVKPILQIMCKRFWPYLVIFGLPAILKIHGSY